MVEPGCLTSSQPVCGLILNGADLHQGKHALMSQVVGKACASRSPIKFWHPLAAMFFAGEIFGIV